ncbi:hypothetical protein BU15DRAFT_48170, partial [Melanogaster broomeanus]
KPLSFHFVSFGPDADPAIVLRRMTQIAPDALGGPRGCPFAQKPTRDFGLQLQFCRWL